MKDSLACFGLFVAAIALIVVGSIMNGWVLSIMWGWFVVPLFGVPVLKVAPAIGVALVAKMLTHQSSSKSNEKKDTSETVGELIAAFLSPMVTLLIGWIVLQFV